MKTIQRFLTFSMLILAIGCNDKGTKIEDPPLTPLEKLYVLNQADATIYIYDTKDMKRIDSISAIVPTPHYFAIAPDKKNFYIMTVGLSSMMAKFDAESDSFISAINVGTSDPFPGSVVPSAIAVTPDGRYGYICDYTAGSTRGYVYKYDLSTMTFLKRMQSGATTHEIQMSPDGKIAIACNRLSDDITFVYTDEDTVTFVNIDPDFPSDPSVPRYGPNCIAFDHHGSKGYVGCMFASQVRVLDINARKIVDSIDIPVNVGPFGFTGPSMVHRTHDGKYLFVTTQRGNTVVVVDLLTKQIAKVIPIGIQSPFGVVVADDDKKVYVTAANAPAQPSYLYIIDVATLEIADSLQVGRNAFGIGLLGKSQ